MKQNVEKHKRNNTMAKAQNINLGDRNSYLKKKYKRKKAWRTTRLASQKYMLTVGYSAIF